MNFLGHLHLSGHRPLVIVGNFMADAVKGRDLSRFHPELAQGIRLHRLIDTFTGTHPLAQAGRRRLAVHAGRYAPVALDLVYDHLLAAHWGRFSGEPLHRFSRRMYTLLQAHSDLMLGRSAHMLPHMVAGDWLGGYATREGLSWALRGLASRAPAADVLVGAEKVLDTQHALFLEEFTTFLSDLRIATEELR